MGYHPNYIAQLREQHSSEVDNVMSWHLLWSPRVEHPLVAPGEDGFFCVVALNDGRSFHIATPLQTGETTVSPPFRKQPVS